MGLICPCILFGQMPSKDPARASPDQGAGELVCHACALSHVADSRPCSRLVTRTCFLMVLRVDRVRPGRLSDLSVRTGCTWG